MFKLTINLGNDAMQTPDDVARALAVLATRLSEYSHPGGGARWWGPVMDDNGNKVGEWSLDLTE